VHRAERRIHAVDGRLLSVLTVGSSQGDHVFFHHGTPGVREMYGPHIEEVARRGFQFHRYSRPGYGGSDRHPGRAIADCAADIAAIADQIGAETFYLIGESGGGPHALACAALLPDRVRAVALLASIAPMGAEGLDWVEGMGQGNRKEFGAAQKGPGALKEYLENETLGLRSVTTVAQLRAALDGHLCEADRGAINGDFGAFLLTAWRQIAEDEIWGWLDDDLELSRDWGFEFDAAVAPVTVWQGCDDLMVPLAHGQWLAKKLPNADFRPVPGVGHISLVAGGYGTFLDGLVASGA
jgi:pimeloyl-ACP methyl ester carboxylesterase